MISSENEKNSDSTPSPPDLSSASIPFEDFGGSIVYDLEQKHTIQEIITTAKEFEKFHTQTATNYFSLIDGLELPNMVNKLLISSNNEYLYLGGSHPPQFILYDLENFSEKETQHTYYHITDMINLCDYDPHKIVCSYENRYIEFFCKHGKYEKIRVPKFCRKMIYNKNKAELFCMGVGKEIYRFNLEIGQFLKTVKLLLNDDNGEVFYGDINPIHNLFGFGCSNGIFECMDPRNLKTCGVINTCKHIREYNKSLFKDAREIMHCKFDPNDGISFAVGTNSGQVGLFDLRKDGVIYVKDHMNDSEITSCIFNRESSSSSSKNTVISSDRYCIKVWNRNNGKNVTNMEPRGRINDVVLYPESGMIFCAQDREKVTPYYVPYLGPTPYWCSFLNSFIGDINPVETTGSMVSSSYSVYDNKFVSVDELKNMGLEDLIGTDVLQPHLHGYLMNIELYKKAHTLKEEDIEDIKIKQKVHERLNSSRISKSTFLKKKSRNKKKRKRKNDQTITYNKRIKK